MRKNLKSRIASTRVVREVSKELQLRAEDLKSLQEKRNEAVQAMKDLTDKAELEERAFTEEETAEFDRLEKEVKDIDGSIERMERARNLNLNNNKNKTKNETNNSEEELEERAFENYIRGVVMEERAANLAVGDNGAVIPTSIANKIIKKIHEISPLYRMATKYNVKGNLVIPYYAADGTDVSMNYADEFTDLTSSTGKFTSIELKGFLAGALTKVSKSLVNNSKFKIVEFVVNNMAEAISRWLEGQLLNGTPSKTDGLIKGITTEVKTAKATAITADELIDLQDSVIDAYQENACWIMSRKTRTAIRKLKDNDGKYLLNPDLTSKWGYTLLGKPVYTTENMKEIAANNTTIVYGDMSGLATKLSEDMEIQVLREAYAAQHAIGVVAWMEFDAKVENAQKVAKLTQNAT